MKNGFYSDLNRGTVLRGARRCMALLLALLMLVPANLATVLAEGTAGAQETRTLRYVGDLSPHKHTKDCRNKDGKLVCGIVEGEYYHEHNQYCRDEAGNLVCGLQEKRPHHHSDSCYKEEKTLVCGLEETAGHQHGEGCYTEKRELTCGLEETAGHQHGADCYTRTLTCGLEETAGHQHGEGCYERRLTCTEEHEHTADCPHEDVLVCGKAEGEGAHAHTDACYTDALTCGKAEGEGAHAHGDACYTVTRELTCGQAEGAGAHAHTGDCWKTARVLTCTEGEPVVIDGVTFKIQTLTSSASDWKEDDVTVQSVAEELTEEEPAAEEPVAEETIAEETAEEDNIGEESAAEETAAEDSAEEETVAEEAAAEETATEETVEEEPAEEETVEEEPAEEIVEEAVEAVEAADVVEEAPLEPVVPEDRTFEYAIRGAQEVALSEVFQALEVVADGEWAGFAAGIEAVEVSNPDALWLEETEGDWVLRAMREPGAGDALTAALADGSKITVEITAYGDTEASAKNDAVVISTVDDMYLPEEASAEAVMPAGEAAPAQMLDVPDPGVDAESVCRVFDIELANVDAQEYEGFDVAVNLDEDVVGADFKLYQVQGDVATDLTDTLELNSQVGADGLESVSGFTFRTDDFAQFVLCYSLETYYKTVEGGTYKITVNFDEAAQIPFGSELKVREIQPGAEEFQRYLAESAAQLGVQSAAVTFARFFDIEIVKDGEKVEPKAPVQVTIAYQDALELGRQDQLNVVHFADAGTEVIEDVSVTDDGTEISYEQGSFSVTGTIVTAPVDEHAYVMVIHHTDGKYYVVENDATLRQIDDEDIVFAADGKTVESVKMVNPLFWTYSTYDGKHNLWFNLDARDYTGIGLPKAYTRRYIKVDSASGYVDLDDTDFTTERPVDYAGNRLGYNGNYVGVAGSGKNLSICGKASEANAAEVYFAQAQVSDNIGARNHTVNHIDISIEGKASLKFPLAYGTYKLQEVDANGEPTGNYRANDLEVTEEKPVTILAEEPVDVTADDMKKVTLTTSVMKNGTKVNIDDAYIVTGYSKNKAGSEGASNNVGQIRLEGSFKVADMKDLGLDPVPSSYSDPNDQSICDMRKEHRIYYDLSVIKPMTFHLIYEDPETGKKYAVMKGNEPFNVTIDVSMATSFDFWDDGNECPGVKAELTGNTVATWRRGGIPDNSSWTITWGNGGDGGPGMDFSMKAPAEADNESQNIVALEVMKTVQDKDGNTLSLRDGTDCTINVYKGTKDACDNKVHEKEINVGTGGVGMIYDYDVTGSADYNQPLYWRVSEDPASVEDELYDTDDHKWLYDSTRVVTEYVWHQDGDPKLHPAKPYTKDDAGEFFSDAEVLGRYKSGNSNLFNGFLEFYVYNIYKPEAGKKQETAPYEGTGVLGGVKVGDEITYEISYWNYKKKPATITIVDTLDENVELVEDEGKTTAGFQKDGNKITWTLKNVEAGEEGTVTLTVKVKDAAQTAGKVVNKDATVKVDNDDAYTLDTVENPVPVPPQKQETAPYAGTGVLGGVKVGDEITYEISYKNYKAEAADIVIVDTLDENVEFVSASDEGAHSGEEAGGVVTWTLKNVEAGEEGTVTLTVKVLEGALESKGGEGKVVNGGDNATVKVGNDNEYTLNKVENPVPEPPEKKEITPYEGTGVLGGVKVGDEITYEISFKNYKQESTTVTIVDKLDPNVKYVDDSVPYGFDRGVYDKNTHTVTWTLNHVAAGREDTVTLIVQVLDTALESHDPKGPGKVVNGGENATVKVGEDHEYTLNTVENPVPEPPEKKETAPYEGTEALGAVKVGDAITYTITYKNYKADAADVVIRDTLDTHVKFVSADNGGQNKDGTVEWTIKAVPAGTSGIVSLTVQVLDTALESHNPNGPGKVVNGGDTATVQVGNDQEFELNEVENPVPEPPHKQEIVPEPPTGSDGTGVLGAVQVDDEITYKISYKNYKNTAADVVIKDKLDTHVKFVSADNGGQNKDGTVEWTIASVPANTEGFVTLTVKVLESAKVPAGPGMVVNGGDTATVKVGNDNEYTLEKVVNPVLPSKQEVLPYQGLDDLGAVKVGDEITYEINYVNYTNSAADIVIVDTLDPNVTYVSSDPTGLLDGNAVKWTIESVESGVKGSVRLTVKVLDTALESHDPAGPGKVVNGGDGTTITVGDKPAIKLNTVENPVPEPPHKKETAPYKGTGELGAVQVGTEITYEISYRNYKTDKADIVIADTLDENVEFVSASDSGWNDNGVVRWTLKDVPPTAEDADDLTVTLTVKVKESALKSKGGEGKVVNGGDTATVKVGNDNVFTLEEVSNPVPESPEKRETVPTPPDGTEGKGLLGPVKVGEKITYKISFKNYKKQDAKIVVKDQLDEHVKYVSSNSDGSHDGSANGGVVTWTFDAIPAGGEREVTLTVEVLPSAQVPEGLGKVVNGGENATVKVGDDMEFKLDTVENPVPPVKRETAPYDQTKGEEPGAVKVGDEITYEICYTNYLNEAAPITIKDKLDAHVEFVEASDGGVNDGGVVKWTIADVPAGEKGKVTLKVKVLDTALESHNPKGPGKVVNGGEGTTVKVGNHHTYTLEPVENPVPEEPVKQETAPYNQAEGEEPGAVKVGDVITYTISYKNYKTEKADVVIKDTLDEHVSFESASDGGKYENGVVTWTLKNVEAGKEGTVTLTVKVLDTALTSKDGPGEVVNGGKGATVKVGNDQEYTLNEVTNPVPETPTKQETAPYDQTKDQELGAVKVGDTITYTISFTNYKKVDATVTIVDKLDENVEFVSASTGSTYKDKDDTDTPHTVTWTLENVEAGAEGTVTLTVKVLEGALKSEGGEGKVVNGGDTASVQVDNDQAYTLNEVENPVPEPPEKKEITPYEGTGVLGGVKVGEKITYEISYRNYKTGDADIVIVDKLDGHVAFSEASDDGKHENGVVTWTLKNVEAGKEGTVTLTVVVLEGALQSMGGKGKVINGGDTATVKVGNDNAYTLNEVENPVPEPPEKKEITPFEGTGLLGAVKAGQEITYEISYKNYKAEPATVAIKDTLDEHVEFVSASDDGEHDGAETGGVVAWKLGPIDAGKEGAVTLTVRVLESAEVSNGGPGKVINGGDNATVQVGEDHEYTLNTVVNPLLPRKQETAPYEGNGVLGGVKVGDEITYEIFYANYLDEASDIVIKDTLDEHVEFVSASDDGEEAGGVVNWTVKDVPAGTKGKVTLTVKVLESALQSNGGPAKVVNGGDNATVKVGNDQEYTLNEVENPVPEAPNKREVKPYEGNGVLGGVKVGDEITYEIAFKNYKAEAADIVIKDTLDKNVEFVDASNDGEEAKGVVTWTLKAVPAGKEGKVTLTVKVLESALESNGGPAKVVNGGENATVKVGEDHEYTLNEVENPVPEAPNKREVKPYEGNGVLGGVKVGDEITYEIAYKNYKAEAADIVIVDTLDVNVEFVSASDDGVNAGGTVTWTIKDVEAGKEGKVNLTVKVLESALQSNGGPAKVVNGGENATVKVGNDNEYTLNEVENPVPEAPYKQEVVPYKGDGVLGAVKVGEEITYEISYRNYKTEKVDIVIIDTLDKNVAFVSASDKGVGKDGVVTWTLKDMEAGKDGTVTLTVKVLEGALESNKGPGKVVNGGDNATVQVGNDPARTLNEVENPVPERPNKQEVKPYKGNGVLGGVKVGDEITYEINYRNYKTEKADIVIVDTLDKNVQFVSASAGGKNAGGKVTWTIKGVEAGKEGKVTLTVKVLKGALKSNGGPGKVVNGGDNATVQVGNDNAYTLNQVENPVPEAPQKREVKPYKGTGKLGSVKVGDTITYEISYRNYKTEKADIVIVDTLDKNVQFVSASDGGVNAKGVVTWTLKGVEAGKEGKVTLKVKVLEGALKSNKGPGKVVNGGDNATVQVGDDPAYTLNQVENPVTTPTTDDTTTTTQTTTLTGHKIWDDEGDVHGLRPQSITLQLLADGTPVNATPEWSDTDTDDWTFTYRNLRATTGSGITIHYTVQEVPVEGYECEINGMTITNHLIPREPESYVDLSGVKTWVDDDDAAGKRPEAITVRLYRDGQVIDVKKVTEADGWKYSFGRLPADDGFGKVFTYVLREDGVEGYYARYNGMNVTNTLLPETPQKEPIVHKGTPRPDFSKFTETMWDELLELLGYDTPLFGMLATGDETPVYPYVFGGVGALAMLAWLALERKKRNAAKQ